MIRKEVIIFPFPFADMMEGTRSVSPILCKKLLRNFVLSVKF